MIPVPDAIISNIVSAHSVLRPSGPAAVVQGGAESFAFTCASLLLSATAKGAPILSGNANQSLEAGSGRGLPRISNKSKDNQKDNLSATVKDLASAGIPVVVAQLAQAA